MIRGIALENFKCFARREEIPLSQITIMYGMNGRGKSTVSQSLLLLAQTMANTNTVMNLQLNGKYVSIGTFNDVVNSKSRKKTFSIILRGEHDVTLMSFEKNPDNPSLAKIRRMEVNGVNHFIETTEDNNTNINKSATKNVRNIKPTSDVQSLQLLKTTKYVSAGRCGPQNTYHLKSNLDDNKELSVDGENVINILSYMGAEFVEMVRESLSDILGGAAIKVSKVREVIELYLNSEDGTITYRPVNVGFGYSYVLAVIVAAHLAERCSLLIIENPEAHLHPKAQSRIMDFLIKIAKAKNIQLLIETHSDHVVNGMRIAVKKGIIDTDDAHILHFTDEEKIVKTIECDKNGELSDYPCDFMDELTSQLLELV